MTQPKTKPKTDHDGKDDEGVVLTLRFSDDKRKKYTIALSDLTSREQIDTEEFFDAPFVECVSSGWLLSSHKGLVWLAFLARRRTDESFTYEQAIDTFDVMVDDQTRPTEVSKETGNPG